MPPTEDPVNHPRHYTSDPSGVEAITICEHRTFCIGNALKYLFRAGKKGGPDKHVQDLEKAVWYIEREIVRITAEREQPQEVPDYDPKTFYEVPGACPDAPIPYELADDADEWPEDRGHNTAFFFDEDYVFSWGEDDCGAV